MTKYWEQVLDRVSEISKYIFTLEKVVDVCNTFNQITETLITFLRYSLNTQNTLDNYDKLSSPFDKRYQKSSNEDWLCESIK